MFSVNFGMGSVSQAANSHKSTKVEVKSKGVIDDTLTWEIAVNAVSEEETAATSITFSAGQSHEAIDYKGQITDAKTNNGYVIKTPTDGNTYTVEVKTKVTDESQAKFTLSAETESDGNTYKDEAEVEVERKAEEAAEPVTEPDKGDKEQQSPDKGEEKESNSATDEEQAEKHSPESDSMMEESEVIGTPHPPFAKTAKPFAIPGVKSGSNWPQPGSLKLEKEASETGSFAEWEVALNVQGKNLKTSSDIVLVFDRSNSMYASRLAKAKAAAKQFVDNLLIDDQSTVRIALVPFGTNADAHTDFQGFSGKQRLKNAIDAIRVTGGNDGGTNIQAGLHSAQSLLSNSDADQKTIVLLSDGEPTYSFKAGNATAHSWPGNKYNFILSDFNYNNRIGSGSSYDLPTGGIFGWGDQRYTVDGYRVLDNGIATISEARAIMNEGTGIYSIGLEVGNVPNAIYTLQNSQNKGYYQGGDDDMTPIFEEIAASLAYAATEAVVTDPLGDMFDLVKNGNYNGENFEVSHGTVSWDDNSETFTWNIGSVKEGEEYTLKYKVTLDCSKNPKTNTKNPTNKETPLNYKDHNGNQATKQFPIPEVEIDTGKITKLGYRVNVDEEPVDSNGNKVGSPAEAERFYEDVIGENLQMNQTYSVPAGETPEGYQLHVGTDPTSVKLTDEVCTTVEFGYVKISELPAGKVTAEYVDEDGNEVAESEVFEGNIGDQYETEKKDISGYEFVKMHDDSANPAGPFTSEEQTVIYVYKQLKGTIKVVKVDEADGNKKLEGAKFTIKNDENEKVGELVTDANGEAVSGALPIGVYTLEEVEAPYGYELSTDQDLSVIVTADGETLITVTNKQLKGSITIIKVDAEDNAIFLENAEFALKDSEGNTVATGTTNGNGEFVFENIPVGNYQLEETKAPENYRLLKKPIDVEVTPDKLQVTKTIENSKQGWEIPKTGGVGTLGFYGVGFILMAIAGWYVFRRRQA